LLSNIHLQLTPHISIGDEEHGAAKDLTHVRFRSAYVKMARSFATADLISTQYKSDLLAAGDPGSEIRRLSEGILKGIGGQFIGRQPHDEEGLHQLTLDGLSDQDAYLATRLDVGSFGLLVPDRPVLWFQHVIPPSMVSLVETNQVSKDMMEHAPVAPLVMNSQEVQRQAREHGVIMVGGNQ
jgi:hypothetical protein